MNDALCVASLDSNECVLNQFAGLGTTGHAVISLNREDGGGLPIARYDLSEETNGSAYLVGQDIIDPFSFNLSVVLDSVRQEVSADLPETFNYLLGLQVNSRFCHDGVLTISGVNPNQSVYSDALAQT